MKVRNFVSVIHYNLYNTLRIVEIVDGEIGMATDFFDPEITKFYEGYADWNIDRIFFDKELITLVVSHN